MGSNRQDDFHNGRIYGADEPVGGMFGWLQRQVDKFLRAGGEPGPATILFTHALDDQLSAMAGGEREPPRTTLPHQTPFDDPLR